MAVKTFTTGEVLTAADTNTYLANAGLDYITSGSTSATGISFNNCFSSTYKHYRIVFWVDSTATTSEVQIRFRASGSDYSGSQYSWVRYNIFMSGGATGSGLTGGQGVSIISTMPKTSTATYPTGCVMDVYGPYVANEFTSLTFASSGAAAAVNIFHGGGQVNQTTQYDGISILSASGNMTASAEVYGYRIS